MGRAPCCEKIGLKRGRWTAEEDQLLVDYIKSHGEGGWRSLPKNAGLLRCGKSCRLRWVNYLREDLKRGNISPEEEETIVKLQATLGNRWSLIAGHLPGRTDNEIKNYWNAHLSKKVAPLTAAEEPGSADEDGGGGSGGEPGSSSNLDGDVCSEDARSTVVNEEKDGQDGGSDDCATSCVLPKRSRKRKAKDSSSDKKKKKKKECKKKESKEKEKEKEKEKAHSRTKVNAVAGGAKKKKRSHCANKGSHNDTCDCRSKDGKRAAAVVDSDPGEQDTGKKELKKKRKNKKPKLAEQAAGVEATANVHQAGAAIGNLPPVITPTEAKVESQPDGGSCCGAACMDVTHRPVDLRPAAHVEDAVKTENGDAVLDVSVHLEDPAMGLDLLEAIDSDTGFLGLITAGSSDPHGGMLLDYMGVSGSDGACCWDGAPMGEEADSKTVVWPESSAGSAQATMFGCCEEIMNPADGITKSSYMDLEGDEWCQPCVGSPVAEDGVGSLQWEAEDDVWKLLSNFVEDNETDVGDQQQQQPAQHVQQQPETTRGFVSGIGSGDDDVFVDGAFDNPWLMADMFLS